MCELSSSISCIAIKITFLKSNAGYLNLQRLNKGIRLF